ncbi:MAG: cell division ATP-binding protein FtsE [Candidatus Nealsonbacteria bacterium]|nr:cell division ATP-binding protein FtsE [Candidatus Nealsonbacteria bacterium]
MIRFDKVTKIYFPHLNSDEQVVAVKDVSFEVKPGEFVSISGKSGAGKTTLLKLLLAEEKPSAGQIFFEGQDIGKIRPEKLPHFRREIGAVFQDYKLLDSKTIFENIAFVLEVIGASDEEIKKDVASVLEIVGLEDRAKHFPRELSGGERQRVAIARAVVHRPAVLLADEPTGNLDPYNTLDIVKLLLKIHEMGGTTVILATHNREIINSLDKRVITLEKGKIIRDENKGRFIL